MWREHIFVDSPHFLTRTMFFKLMFFSQNGFIKSKQYALSLATTSGGKIRKS